MKDIKFGLSFRNELYPIPFTEPKKLLNSLYIIPIGKFVIFVRDNSIERDMKFDISIDCNKENATVPINAL